MIRIIQQQLANLIARKSLQIALLMVFLSIGIFSALSYQNFLFLQAQNISQLSVFNEIIKPLSGLVLFGQVFIIALVSSQLSPYLFSRGQQGLLVHSVRSDTSLVFINLVTVFIFGLIPFGYFCLILFAYIATSDIDIGLLLSTSMALLIGNLLFSLLIASVTLLTKKTLTGLIVAIMVTLTLLGFDEFLRNQSSTISISIFLNFFIHLRDGLVIPAELFRAIVWSVFFFALSILSMQKLRYSNGRVGLIVCLIAIGLLSTNWLFLDRKTNDFNLQWDISRANLNSLEEDYALQIAKIDSPVIITAVIDDENNHDEIRQAFDVISQYHPDSKLEFSSRQALPNQSAMVDQFITVKINDQVQSIRYPFDRNAKDAISQVIIQLTTRGNQWITFIEGHGEASPFGKTSRDIGSFYQSLKELGWPVAMQNLSKQPMVSDNTKILVIAGSKKEWMLGELDALMGYLKKGGNLLLLREAEDNLPEELISYLGINRIGGTLIDWQGYQSGTPHPAILIVNQFADHPINTSITSLIAFPWSVGLEINPKQNKPTNQYQVIMQTHKGVWNEFDSEQLELSFNPEKGEQRQIFDLGFSIKNETNNQRIIVMGDSSFLSDSAINNYANRQFALNTISWLSSQSIEMVSLQYHDNFIQITPWLHFLLKWVYSSILPVLIFIILFFSRSKIFSSKFKKSHPK